MALKGKFQRDRLLLFGGVAVGGFALWKLLEFNEPISPPQPPLGPTTCEAMIILRDATTSDYVIGASVKIYSGETFVGDAVGVLEGSTWTYQRVVPQGSYTYTVSAPGFLSLEGAFEVTVDNLGKILLIEAVLHSSPKWTAQLYWAGAEQIPFVVNGITYYGGWIKRALVPWDIALGETVEAPSTVTDGSRVMAFRRFNARVYDVDHLEVDWYKAYIENPATIVFPAKYAVASERWQIEAYYVY